MSTSSVISSTVRVRIAPSPTGNLHVGTARAALFNYLFAKHNGGKFILRIEDTDLERSQKEYTQNIFDSLKALGLSWDEGPDVGGPFGPYRQMERLEHYQRFVAALLEAGLAYHAYETPEELEAQREAAQAAGQNYVYRKPDAATLERMKAEPGRTPSVRFEVPPDCERVVFTDAIRGDIVFERDQLSDFVIQKSNGVPTYNFAVVVDDVLMKITHVIRGEDHISNTPRQILLYQAFAKVGLAPDALPQFAHMGMILAPDRTKLSKRHGATAVSEFMKQGYLPEAFCNFLSLLGWSPGNDVEIGTLQEFSDVFSLERVVHSPAVFEMDKLNWFNRHYLKAIALEDFIERARPFLSEFDLTDLSDEKLAMMLDAVRERITTLLELPAHVAFFFGHTAIYEDAETVNQVLNTEEGRMVLGRFTVEFLPSADFASPDALSAGFHHFLEAMKPLKTKAVMWPVRVALSGRTQGIDLGQTLYILGKNRVADRIEAAQRLVAVATAG